MQKTDRFTKTLLVLLVLGVWGLLLRPFVPIAPVEAQSGAGTKWEYHAEPRLGGTDWNQLGKQGWELAAVSNDWGYFKHRK